MCVAIPKKVLALHKTASGTSADVDNGGELERVDTSLIESVSVGDFVLVFRGNALRVVDAEEAAKIQSALDCVQKVMDREFDENQIQAGFADLDNASSALPPHLARIVGKKVM